MAYRSFDVQGEVGFRRAALADVPNLVVIAGPNGSGKSRLLYALSRRRSEFAEEGTQVSYLGPHRSWRRTTPGVYSLSELKPTLSDYLQEPAIPGWRQFQPPGMQHVQVGTARDPTGTDDSFAFVKSSILKIDSRLQVRLRAVFQEEGGQIPAGRFPDVFAPLSEALNALLPHLEFLSADFSDESALRVTFRRIDGPERGEVELDDLSSGEKSAIGLVLPTVERQIVSLLGDGAGSDGPIPTTLIDEPEIHLHPSLQILLLDYLAGIAARGEAQFILTTHSPTMVDALHAGLYLMAPLSQVPDGNQLLSLGDAAERLDAMRALTGATHLLTRCRPIVYLEGERPAEKPVSDQRLVEILIPPSAGWILVASKGQGEAIVAGERLREALAETVPGFPVFALVDCDQAQEQHADWVITWPVAMVENLLLDADAIWEVLEHHREVTGLTGPDGVSERLREAALEQRGDEIRLRVKRLARNVSARVKPESRTDLAAAVSRAKLQLEEQLADLDAAGPIVAEWETAERAVQAILDAGRELELFRGKPIFDAFYDRHAKSSGLAKRAFAYAVASSATRHNRLTVLVSDAVRRISEYVPDDLVAAAEEVSMPAESPDLRLAVEKLKAAREAWERGESLPTSGEDLRETTVDLARQADGAGQPEVASRLRTCAASLAPQVATAVAG
jgi:energy-coupling factor transporter ATP-binding protein EcfA2